MEAFDYKKAKEVVSELVTSTEKGRRDMKMIIGIGFMILKGLSIISSQLEEVYMSIPEGPDN